MCGGIRHHLSAAHLYIVLDLRNSAGYINDKLLHDYLTLDLEVQYIFRVFEVSLYGEIAHPKVIPGALDALSEIGKDLCILRTLQAT